MNGKDSSGIDRTCDVQYRAFLQYLKLVFFLKESKKEASDEREGVQLVKILEGNTR